MAPRTPPGALPGAPEPAVVRCVVMKGGRSRTTRSGRIPALSFLSALLPSSIYLPEVLSPSSSHAYSPRVVRGRGASVMTIVLLACAAIGTTGARADLPRPTGACRLWSGGLSGPAARLPPERLLRRQPASRRQRIRRHQPRRPQLLPVESAPVSDRARADRCRPQRAARLPMGRQAQPFRADPLSSRYEVDPLHLQQRVRVRLLLRRRPRAHLHV